MQAQTYKRIFVFEKAQYLPLSETVVQAAVAANPWFTETGIRLAFNALQAWFDTDTLKTFISGYSENTESSDHFVGIITAGNIPFVGMHDVLMAFLAGRKVAVKCARQDAILLPWFWNSLLADTEFAGQVQFVEALEPPAAGALILATGGDHTARQLAWKFRDHTLLMRNNRFSAAVVDVAAVSTTDWSALCEDMLLYNGLGCRNVSNLLLINSDPNHLIPKDLEAAVQAFSSPTLAEAYRLSRAYDRARVAIMPPQAGLETPWLRFVPADHIQPMAVGQVAVIAVDSVQAAQQMVAAARAQLQVVVGTLPGMVPFGQAQHPALHDFADGVDTFAACLR